MSALARARFSCWSASCFCVSATRALLSALPSPDPDTADSRERIVLVGDVPSPVHPPPGCRFHPRCPKARLDCASIEPSLVPVLGDAPDHPAACRYPLQAGEDLSLAVPEVAEPGPAGRAA